MSISRYIVLARVLGIAVGEELHRALEVGEKDRHLFAFIFEGSLRGLRLPLSLIPALAGSARGGRGFIRAVTREDPRARRAMTENGCYVVYAPFGIKHPESSVRA